MTRLAATNINPVNREFKDSMAQYRRDFTQNINKMSQFQTQAMSLRSPINQLTEDIRRGELAFGNWGRAVRRSGDIAQQQMRLRSMMFAQFRRDAMGDIEGEMIIPQKAMTNISQARMQMSVLAHATRSAAQNLVNFGKNVQWAGRQLTVGLTLPLSILGFTTQNMARQVDEQLVRLQKVYETTTDNAEAELNKLKDTTIETSRTMAEEFGIAQTETLQTAADFAVLGYQGEQLQDQVREASRLQMLAAVEQKDAIDLTRSTQAVWRLETEELTDTFNKFNLIENQTALQVTELASSLPEVAGTFRTLNVSAEEGAAMMASMKEQGVGANEAAHALKFGLSRVVNATPAATKAFGDLGVELDGIFERHGGDMMAVMEEISLALSNIESGGQRLAALTELVGRRQADRLIKLTDQMGAFAQGNMEHAGAFAVAMDIVETSSEHAAERAEEELGVMQESLSGTFERLKASIGVEMAEIGQRLLEPINKLMRAVLELLRWFNQLDGMTQKIVQWGLIFAGLVGPVVMLTGLMANFVGQIISFGAWIAILITRLPMMNKEQALSALLARDNASAFLAGSNQLQVYHQQAQKTTAAIQQLTAAQQGLSAAQQAELMGQTPETGYGYGKGMKRPNITTSTGAKRFPTKDLWRQNMLLREQSSTVEGISENVNKKNKAWAGSLFRIGAISLALPAINMLMTEVVGETNAWVRALVSAGTMMLIMPGTLGAIKAGVKGVGKAVQQLLVMGWGLKTALGTQGVLGTIKALGTGLGTVLTGALAIKAALLAIPLAIVGAIWHMRHLRDSIGETAEKAQTAADALSEMEAPSLEVEMSEEERAHKERMDRIRKFRDENEDVINDIRELRTEEAQREYISNLIWQMERRGESPDEIKAKIKDSFEASGVKLDVEINPIFDNNTREAIKRMGDEMFEASDVENRGFWEKLNPISWFGTPMAEEGIGHARNYGENIAAAVNEGLMSGGEFDMQIIDDIRSRLDVEGLENDFRDVQNEIDSLTEDLKGMSWPSDEREDAENRLGRLSDEARNLQNEIARTERLRFEALEVMAEELGLGDDLIEQNSTLGTVMRELGSRDVAALSEATKIYNRELGVARMNSGSLSEAQKDQIYMSALQEAGFEDVEEVLKDVKEEQGGLAEATEEGTDAMEEQQRQIDSWLGTMRSSISSELDGVLGAATDAFEAETQAREDEFDKQIDNTKESLEEEKEARLDAFDEMEEDRLDSIDNEIEALENRTEKAIEQSNKELEKIENNNEDKIDAIKAEQEADDKREENRQKMFRREQERHRHEASMRQQGISARMAELRGDLEESAIIRDQMRQEDVSRAIDLADEEAKDAAEKRKEQRDNKIDQLEREMEMERTAHEERQNMLEEDLENRKSKLEDQKEILKERLEDERDALETSLNNNIETEVQRLENAKKSYSDQRDDHKEMLDNKLQDFRNWVPQSEKEYRENWLPKVDAVLKEFGLSIQEADKKYIGDINDSWITAVDAAQKEIAEEKRWEQFGEDIGNAVAKGISGDLTLDDMVSYIKTGEFPGGQSGSSGMSVIGGNRNPAQGVMHTGGFVGGPAKQRRGTADKLRHDEVSLIGQKGEYMIDKNTVKKYGTGFFRSLQNSRESPSETGNGSRFHEGGEIANSLGELAAGATARIASQFLQGGFMQRQMEDMGRGGGGSFFSGSALEAFAKAIRQLESGGNYSAVGPRHPTMGRALGAYQIMESNWGPWAREAGIPGANWRDRENQDTVAMNKFQQYFEQFKDWAAVAVSWFAGPGRAQRYMQDPSSVGGISDVLGTTVASYVQRIMSTMQQYMAESNLGGPAVQGMDLQPPDGDRTRGGTVYYGGWKHKLKPYVIRDTIQALASIPGGQYITSAYRNRDHNRRVGGAENSDHMTGKGLDIASETGDLGAIARAFRGNPRIRWISPPGMYGSHRHISWNHEGGQIGLPQLRNGGEAKFDNTLANLHRGETVLTSPLTDAFKDNVMQNGGHSEYNIHVNVQGTNASPDEIARVVETRLARKEIRQGKGRRV